MCKYVHRIVSMYNTYLHNIHIADCLERYTEREKYVLIQSKLDHKVRIRSYVY